MEAYNRGRSITVIADPAQLDERTDGGALGKWSVGPALLGNGLGRVVKTMEEAVELPLALAEPLLESGGLSRSCVSWVCE